MPAKKPIQDLILTGSYRADKHGELDEQFEPGGVPVCPDWLEGEAAVFWARVIQPLVEKGVGQVTDQATCESAAFWWAECCRTQELCRKTSTGAKSYYRNLVQAAMCQKQFNSLASKLGLSPVDRRNIGPVDPKLQGDDESEFFNG